MNWQLYIEKIKYIWSNLLMLVIDNLIKIFYKPQTFLDKSLLLVVFHGIGDYVLFRNYLLYIRNSHKYRDYKIYLIGNSDWKSLAEEIDKDCIDYFFWIDKNKFGLNPAYRWQILQKCRRIKYEIIFNPTYIQQLNYDSSIVNVIEANLKFGCCGPKVIHRQKKIYRYYYDKIYEPKLEKGEFLFYTNGELVSDFIEEKIESAKLNIELKHSFLDSNDKLLPNSNYVCFFVGSSTRGNSWNIENFLRLTKYLNKQNVAVILLGGKIEKAIIKPYLYSLEPNVINLIGKLSLPQTAEILYKSKLLLTNDTGGSHIAMATKTKNVVVLSNGHGYPLYCPYPKEFSNRYTLIMPPIQKGKHENDINLIQYEEVKNIVLSIFNFKNNKLVI